MMTGTKSDGDDLNDGNGISGNEDQEVNCPICLLPFTTQDIGTPESCDHEFCLTCIKEWAKTLNTCPFDRRVFHIIFARHSRGGRIYEKIHVEDRRLDDGSEDEDDLTYCEVCGDCRGEDRMILCDSCDNGYHMDCLTPPLDSVPEDDWFCPECEDAQAPQPSTSATNDRGHVLSIPRTLRNRRVYQRVALVFSDAQTESESESEGEEIDSDTMNGEEEIEASSTDDENTRYMLAEETVMTSKPPPTKRKKTRRKRTASKRRRKSTPRKTKRKTRRRKTWSTRMRKLKAARNRKPTIRQNLAGKLGIGPPRAGQTLPVAVKDKRMAPAVSYERFSMFGDADSGYRTIGELDSPFSQRKTSSTDKLSRCSSTDLLSNILDSQELLGKKSEDIEIQTDGQLKLKQPKKFQINLKTTAISLPASPLTTVSSEPHPNDRTHTPEHPSVPTQPATTKSLAEVKLPCSSSSPNLQLDSPLLSQDKDVRDGADMLIGDDEDEAEDAQNDSLTIEAELNLDDIPLPSDLDKVPLPSDIDQIPLPSEADTRLYLENIPLPESDYPTKFNHLEPKAASSIDKTDCSLPSYPPGQSSGDLGKTDSSLNNIIQELTGVSRLKPPPQIITAYPVHAIKKEGRKIYDSRDKEEIIGRFKKMADRTSSAMDLEEGEICEDDDEIYVLTPPPRSPESVVVLTTDSEDERLNIDKAKKQKKRKRSRSQENASRRRRSISPRDRSLRDRSPLNSSSKSSPRKRLSRNRSPRNRSRYSPIPVRRLTPIKDRLGYQHRRNPDRVRRSRTRSPIRRRSRSPSVNRRRLRSPSPIRRIDLRRSPSRNGLRNSPQRNRRQRSSSRQRPNRNRTDSAGSRNIRDRNITPERNRRRSRNGPLRRSRSPTLQRRRSRSRDRMRSRTPERGLQSVAAATHQSSSLSLAAELEKTRSSGVLRSKSRSISPQTHSSGRSKSSKKGKSKRSKNSSKKKKKKKTLDDGKDGESKKKKKKVRSKRSVSHASSGAELEDALVVNLVSEEEEEIIGPMPMRPHESHVEQSNDNSIRSESPFSEVSRPISSVGVPTSRHSREREQSRERSRESSREQSRASSRAQSRESSRAQSRESSRAQSRASSREQSGASSREQSRERSKEQSRIRTRELLMEWSRERTRDRSMEHSREQSRERSFEAGQACDIDEKGVASAADMEVQDKEEEESLAAPQSDASSISDQVSELEDQPELDAHKQDNNVAEQNSPVSSHDMRDGKDDVTVSSTVIDHDELDKQTELQALQVIELLKNEVADPDVAPPAQPPKSVAQKPLVIDWLIQKLGTDTSVTPINTTPVHTPPRVKETISREDTTTLATSSSTSAMIGEDEELPSSATELSNRQKMDEWNDKLLNKMVGQERIADEVKIILKPYYCKNTINKEEYKHIMRNCVTKIYQKTQGRVNPVKVKDFVEKYVGNVIARRK